MQVAIVCCLYYHLRAKQIFILQNIDAASTLCNMKFIVRGLRESGNTGNKQSQLAAQYLLRDKLQETVAGISWSLALCL